MVYSLTIDGYTFENPPEEYRKLARLGNNPQTAVDKTSAYFYQSDSQDLQLQLIGTLALDPPLGEDGDDLDELERLQEIAIKGGEVLVEFDPFFSGQCVIEDDPFRQQPGESEYRFTLTINSESTDTSAYPARSPPDTGNTFELGNLNIGYDPNSVEQNYNRQTEGVKRLQGIKRTVDNAGLVTEVNLSGLIDGVGQARLWQKARANVLAYLTAEFQNGWCLIDSLSIRNVPEAPDYLTGMFRYDLDVLIVMDPTSGIGEVSQFVDQEVKEQDAYVSDCDTDGVFERSGNDTQDYPEALEYTITGGTGKLNGDYVEWPQHTGTLAQNETNYIWVQDSEGDGYGQVATGTNGFPGNSVELFEVVTGTSSVDSITDRRACLMGERLGPGDVGDLNFSDDLSVEDTLDFERIMALADAFGPITESEEYQGIARLTETLGITEGGIEGRGIASLTETASLDDGGTPEEISSTATLSATTTLNGNSITATVYEDTSGDGTADNQESISLNNGAETYELPSLEGSPSNTYWITFDLASDDGGQSTPEVDSATIEFASGEDMDQNQNTTWEIQGAKHDTSGNEYEGGGVVSRYGA